ncbi:GNAT family N-acetyltransferase [Salegentibacter sp. F188]|uniref:GNAT family N-acetyltransferase n=1 Tax=Autumnicola patrickiae TaxID=3075591 RepID=A0ABU3E1K7_9FLAO|nr:GNAT family N-acetyltransferase [Salegentibacter sp. F188]MDT0689822.1 GNAT family N-acetyltransferase [Salegentibacter sp. F188]
MLKFRKIDYDKDVDEIIKLLNANFETDHTKEAFLWKHFENPFGQSYGLLAVDNHRIVGLRMFMRWEFLCDNKVIKAIRPVDTCTDHDYRGKGLFKKITLQGLENIKEEYDLVFNTPNENSKPGYLKMGWKPIDGNFSYKVGLINFLKGAENFEEITSKEMDFQKSWLEELSCQTNISKDYFTWRYADQQYKIAKFKDGGTIVYKLTKLKGIKSIILVDSFGGKQKSTQRLISVCSKNKAKAVYFLDNEKNKHLKFLLKFDRGSQAVVSKDDEIGVSGKIAFSVGDLEGRI